MGKESVLNESSFPSQLVWLFFSSLVNNCVHVFSHSFNRFYCAGAADNRTRLHFHGERRIWDGRLIKQKIKGNSALYIYADEVLLQNNKDLTTKLNDVVWKT